VNLDILTPKVVDFLEIKDAETGEVLLRQRGHVADTEAEKLRRFLSQAIRRW
jgi:hypothetical protein